MLLLLLDFFFCKQKTAYEMRISDWSSDVCSSDLRLPDYPHDHLGGNAVDRLPSRLSAAARPALVRAGRLADLLSAGLLLVVVLLRCLCPADLHRRGVYRGIRRFNLHRRRGRHVGLAGRSEEHTSELQSLMRISYAVFC